MIIRRILFWSHLVVGCTAGLVIAFMCLTGMMMAFEHQIEDFVDRKLQTVEASPEAKRLEVSQVLTQVRQDQPDASPSGISIYSRPNSSILINFGEGKRDAYVNPYTGKVLGEASVIHEWMHQIEDLHRWLGSRKIGKPITGVCVILFFVLILSGLYLWWPGKVFRFKRALSGKPRNWNWHNTIGFWCSALLLSTTLTGIIMAHTWASNLLYYATGNKPPGVADKKDQGRGVGEMNIDAIIRQAQNQMPDWAVLNMRLTGKSSTVVMIQDQTQAKSKLTLVSTTGEIIKWEPFAQNNLGMKLRFWTKQLHTGGLFGLPNQILIFIGALGGVFLVWTGYAMTWHRLFLRKPKSKKGNYV